MALVNVVNMNVLDNPTNFLNPFQFEITFECLQELDDDLEWKVLYVGNAKDATSDVVLDEILVGPVPVGVNKFVLSADAPSPSQLAQDEVLGVTVVLVTCSYREKEFVRVGYYVNNEYTAEYDEAKGPPKPYDFSVIQRQILADKPRVTKFPIPWGDPNEQVNNAGEQGEGTDVVVGGDASDAVISPLSNDKSGGQDGGGVGNDDSLVPAVSSE